MKIEGVPEGWELVRIGTPEEGELYMEGSGHIRTCPGGFMGSGYAIFKKIEKPKRYRPFASDAEFAPHRNRWWRYKNDPASLCRPPRGYHNDGWLNDSWPTLFDCVVFDDGTPFGIEVTE